MLHLVETARIYPPETVAVMTAAFDSVCRSLSRPIEGLEDVHEKLALTILRYVDDGERDPKRLAEISLRELAGIDRSATI